jgi:hypothetical protein
MSMSIYPKLARWPFRIVFAIAVIGVGVVIGTIVAGYRALCYRDVVYLYGAIIVWAVGPPVWFWVEYFAVFMRWGIPDKFDHFKYGQQVAAAIWAAILASLFAFAASGVVDPTKETLFRERCTQLCGTGPGVCPPPLKSAQ